MLLLYVQVCDLNDICGVCYFIFICVGQHECIHGAVDIVGSTIGWVLINADLKKHEQLAIT